MINKKVLVPIYKEISGDLDTPVSAYLKLNHKNSFLLESVTGGEQVSRYSFIGFDPFCVFCSKDGKTKIKCHGKDSVVDTKNPIDELKALVNNYDLKQVLDLPFISGAVGFFSWEIINYIEDIPKIDKPGTEFPLAHYLFPGSMVVFDHVKRKIIIVAISEKGQEIQAKIRVSEIENLLKQPVRGEALDLSKNDINDVFEDVKSNYTKKDFESHVGKVKEHIYDGDIFQLVLSQRFTMQSYRDPFDIYRALRYINPSPYMYYFNFDDYQIVGASPEILVRLRDNKATLRPIAGTRPRIEGQDDVLIEELLNDEKERAEHIMLVDLGRNDLGKVCEYGSVKTTDIMQIEKYSHVMHMVANVEGELCADKDAFDLFKATFPAGTLSGAPKVKAIEIIEELEPEGRGPYGGA